MAATLALIPSLLVAGVLVFGPGLAVLAAAGGPLTRAICLGPLLSLGWYGLAGVAYALVGVPYVPASVLLPPLVFALALVAVRRRAERDRGASDGAPVVGSGAASAPDAASDSHLVPDPRLLLAYLCFGLAVGWFVFLRRLSGADAFIWLWDSDSHLSIIRSIMERQVGTSLRATGFYPSALHCVVALGTEVLGYARPTPLLNATLFVLLALAYPAGLCALLTQLFDGDRHVVAAGAVVALATGVFPWQLLVFGPLFANAAASALTPALLCLSLGLADAPVRSLRRLRAAGAGALAVAGLALVHPSMAFFAWVVAASHVAWRIVRADGPVLDLQPASPSRAGKAFAATAFLLANALVWRGLFLVSATLRMMAASGTQRASVMPDALLDALCFAYNADVEVGPVGWPQPVLAFLLALGMVSLVWKHREQAWVLLPYGFFLLSYVLVSTSSSWLMRVLNGFWYNDTFRVSANCCLAAMPLLAAGLALPLDLLLGEGSDEESALPAWPHVRRRAVAVALVAVLAFANYGSFVVGDERNAVRHAASDVRAWYGIPNHYSGGGADFVEAALALMDDPGAPVANVPYDGSVYAYGVSGMNTYFRSDDVPATDKTPESEVLRTRLCDVATDAEVQAAVRSSGLRYVLQLEHELPGEVKSSYRYDEEDWVGINQINETTPGFTLLLSDGDFCFYRIDLPA